MTLPYALRFNTLNNFPATVKGSGPILIAKSSGIWTVSLTITQLGFLSPGFDPSQTSVLVWSAVSQSFFQMTIATLLLGNTNVRIVTAAGDVTVLVSDGSILMNKTVSQITNINLPTSASRGGAPLYIKDYKGDAQGFPITLVPSGAETIDLFSGAAAAANGTAVIRINKGAILLRPLASGGWYL